MGMRRPQLFDPRQLVSFRASSSVSPFKLSGFPHACPTIGIEPQSQWSEFPLS